MFTFGTATFIYSYSDKNVKGNTVNTNLKNSDKNVKGNIVKRNLI